MNEAQTTLRAWETQRQQHQSFWDKETEETKDRIVDDLAVKILTQALSTLGEAVSNPNYQLPTFDQPIILNYPISMASCSRLVLEVLPDTSCVREWLRPHPKPKQQDEFVVEAVVDLVERRALSVDREALDMRLAQLGSLCATRLWNKCDVESNNSEGRLGFEVVWIGPEQGVEAKLSRIKEPARTQQLCMKLWLKEPAACEQALAMPPKKRESSRTAPVSNEVIVVGHSESNGRRRGRGCVSHRK